MKEEQTSGGPCQVPAQVEEGLRQQAIGVDGPGTILRDFGALLDLIGRGGLPTTGRRHLLPHSCLVELNARLAQPLEVRLKRPQQRSYPNLDGLYLVGRATGLIRARGTGAKGMLVVDETVRGSWDGLNPTEQYFTLMEAWLVHGRPGILGKGRDERYGSLFNCAMLWKSVPSRGLRLSKDMRCGRYLPGVATEFHHLALMGMFGLLAVEQDPAIAGEVWTPRALRRTAWGDAVFKLFEAAGVVWSAAGEARRGEAAFGWLQGLFGRFFPAWQKNLMVPAPAFREGVFVFRVSLGRTRRLIALSARRSLESLVAGILDAFGFDNDHLYSFTYTDRFGATVRALHPYCEEPPSTDEVFLGDLPLEQGEAMEFLYDFGDSWRFEVKLDRVEPLRAGFAQPVVLEAHGEAPPQYGRGEE